MNHKTSKVTRSVNRVLTIAVFLLGQLFCSAIDTIEYGLPLQDNGQTLVSAGKNFEMGFFTRGISSEKRYVGIWYKASPGTIVWVANRDNPILPGPDATGVFGINEDGNLQVLANSSGESLWSTKINETLQSPNKTTAKLMDSGNLVLSSLGEKSLWESFKDPTDTFLPGMEMVLGLKLSSWRKIDDPGTGDFVFELDDETRELQYSVTNGSVPYWRSGVKFAGSDKIPGLILSMLSNYTMSSNYMPENSRRVYNGMRLAINFDGTVNAYRMLQEGEKLDWHLIWSVPSDVCSVSNACGSFGVCVSGMNILVCKCLPGFKPTYPVQWGSRDFSGGCIERTGPCGDSFLKLQMMDLEKPELAEHPVSNEVECMEYCSRNCRCKAFSFSPPEEELYKRGNGFNKSLCSIWFGTLQGLQEGYARGRNLSVRVTSSDLEFQPVKPSPLKKNTPLPLIIVPTVLSVALLACSFICFIIVRRRKISKQENSRRSDQRRKELLKLDTQKHIDHLISTGEFEKKDEEGIDVPFISFDSIIEATNSFSDANKLGQGGYGPVYKGVFSGGHEIAVKRLSTGSGQGLEEFKNEVVLIAKLQHRNLVKLRGYCMEGDEKILLYEYMPNRSLDAFIFDDKKSMILDWEKRFSIILGIARGLLYLHQDSRLRIIHRDLKTSNILLDQDMEPKISDFGLARIVGGTQTEANTNRVVGTFGYISPEYALEGLFSVKSDVFSFGVVLLEIISGKRSMRLVQSESRLSLLGYAWRVWTENNAMELIDPCLGESCKEDQFLKCVKVGLLCVQEDPSERPTMSSIVTMLDSESASVPNPQQPAFVLKRGYNVASSSSSSKPDESHAEITATVCEGR